MTTFKPHMRPATEADLDTAQGIATRAIVQAVSEISEALQASPETGAGVLFQISADVLTTLGGSAAYKYMKHMVAIMEARDRGDTRKVEKHMAQGQKAFEAMNAHARRMLDPFTKGRVQ